MDCGEDILLARMDAKLIVQVLVNLINNAVKYTQAGSKIRITAGKEEKNVWIAVEDNGPGIPAECREHVFEMFYSGKNKVSDSLSLIHILVRSFFCPTEGSMKAVPHTA